MDSMLSRWAWSVNSGKMAGNGHQMARGCPWASRVGFGVEIGGCFGFFDSRDSLKVRFWAGSSGASTLSATASWQADMERPAYQRSERLDAGQPLQETLSDRKAGHPSTSRR